MYKPTKKEGVTEEAQCLMKGHSRKLKIFAKPDQRVAQRHELRQGKGWQVSFLLATLDSSMSSFKTLM
jgi:hypothetical protein